MDCLIVLMFNLRFIQTISVPRSDALHPFSPPPISQWREQPLNDGLAQLKPREINLAPWTL